MPRFSSDDDDALIEVAEFGKSPRKRAFYVEWYRLVNV